MSAPAGEGPVQAALAGDPVLAQHYADFRRKAEGALAPQLVALIRQAVAQVHGVEATTIDDSALDQCLEAITKAANTGKVGDGKIFVATLDEVVRIRTGETGPEAV